MVLQEKGMVQRHPKRARGNTSLYLVQHLLQQIKAQQFYTNFLVLMSPLSQSSISEEF